MRAYLSIEISIPDYELVLARAKLWEQEHKYKYSEDEVDALLSDYLMSDINIGYSITNRYLEVRR